MDQALSGSFQLSRSSHAFSLHSRLGPSSRDELRCASLVSRLPSRHRVGIVRPFAGRQVLRGLSPHLLLPLLEDLWYLLSDSDSNSRDAWETPSSSPKLSGVFSLSVNELGPIIPRLLRLPGGVHFTDIRAACSIEVAQ